ncbi:hypothetical protein BO94DRAFT_595956 [Aspergillus sclerotioniger CBS 115572]|uniref:Uncharacterized protein n=1 Tax=Aspergillus sclerotioniger CBS 115572 TaxID=1450535 RepID=A0A317WNQ5_9EURO|nr:hypothetical protein BO94DRAFT_595956 [Aspergillus sclerotioniger CBS 115572]PWY88104.1 hypothetical protein BO94DRAFT_595956 [Aspergillus sclerotioniger CBS 115572]
MPIPTTNIVTPGTSVNIILKADQPTGRTVSGVISEVLTRGNHPRGIKVRLRDGRVGRVQSLVSTSSSSSSYSSLGDSTGGEGKRVRFVGDEEGESRPEERVGLDAYVVPGVGGRQQGGRRGGMTSQSQRQSDFEYSIVKCPVCGEFEGDEAAVAHHVAGHFD